jgi:hypothetical protein
MGAFGLVWYSFSRFTLIAQFSKRRVDRSIGRNQENHETIQHTRAGKENIPRVETPQAPEA